MPPRRRCCHRADEQPKPQLKPTVTDFVLYLFCCLMVSVKNLEQSSVRSDVTSDTVHI